MLADSPATNTLWNSCKDDIIMTRHTQMLDGPKIPKLERKNARRTPTLLLTFWSTARTKSRVDMLRYKQTYWGVQDYLVKIVDKKNFWPHPPRSGFRSHPCFTLRSNAFNPVITDVKPLYEFCIYKLFSRFRSIQYCYYTIVYYSLQKNVIR